MSLMTWDEYKGFVGKLIANKYQVMCRGHTNESWKLMTSFHRLGPGYQLTLAAYLDTVLPEIHYQIGAVREEVIDLNNKEEFAAFLALLQHHGFPTPLLDWTMSPYIAAYFAFKEVTEPHPFSDNVKIYIFDYLEWLRTLTQPLDLRDISVRYVSLIRPYARFTPRMVAQQGMFTVTNVEDMEQYISEVSTQYKKKFLYDILISSKEKPAVLRELNSMGINEMTLFPGIDGICRAMKARFFAADKIELISELMQKTITPSTGGPVADEKPTPNGTQS